MTAEEAQVLKIGQLAALTGLTVRTLHHYDHLGLVTPRARTASAYRLYVESGVQRLYQLLALRQIGLPLDAIKEVLDGTSSIRPLLEQHRSHLDRQLVTIRTLRAHLSTMIAASQDGDPLRSPTSWN
jgi:DNA-binding transcriptional MerR regulator